MPAWVEILTCNAVAVGISCLISTYGFSNNIKRRYQSTISISIDTCYFLGNIIIGLASAISILASLLCPVKQASKNIVIDLAPNLLKSLYSFFKGKPTE